MNDDQLHQSFYSAHGYVDREITDLVAALPDGWLDPDAQLTPAELEARERADDGRTR
jgi:hypothetical protein